MTTATGEKKTKNNRNQMESPTAGEGSMISFWLGNCITAVLVKVIKKIGSGQLSKSGPKFPFSIQSVRKHLSSSEPLLHGRKAELNRIELWAVWGKVNQHYSCLIT